MKASEKFKKGKYVGSNQVTNSDGSITISIFDPKSVGKKYMFFTVKNLNRDNEEIVSDEEE